jgi:Transposase
MSVYVGIDVHRKRSQVAVIDQDGEVLANRNVPNGTETILNLIGGLPPGTPAAFEAAFGWGWLLELLEDYGFDPHLVHPLRCKAIGSARLKNDKGRRRDPGASCCAPICCRRRGSRRRKCASCGRRCGSGFSWCGCGRCCATASTRSWLTTGMTGRPGAGAARAGPGSPPWTCRRRRRR